MMKTKIFFLLFISFFTFLFACEGKKEPSDNESKFDEKAYFEKGQAIAAATFTALSGKLQSAMKEGGVPNAVEYCNLAAFPLVDSLSNVYKASIRRTSFKVRNPKDAPSQVEKGVLEEYEKTASTGGDLKPIVKQMENGKVVFYAPIKVNAFCLKCHGKIGETLKEEDYSVIKKAYPEDEAIGYVDGDLRGMWSIKFE